LHFSEAERGYFEIAEKDEIYRKVKAEIIEGKAMDRDLFDWFNEHGVIVKKVM